MIFWIFALLGALKTKDFQVFSKVH